MEKVSLEAEFKHRERSDLTHMFWAIIPDKRDMGEQGGRKECLKVTGDFSVVSRG